MSKLNGVLEIDYLTLSHVGWAGNQTSVIQESLNYTGMKFSENLITFIQKCLIFFSYFSIQKTKWRLKFETGLVGFKGKHATTALKFHGWIKCNLDINTLM